MKFKWVTCVFLVLVAIAIRLSAQQSDAGRKLFEDTKVKAESGNVNAQFNLGTCYHRGEGVTQDYAEAVKWFRKAADQGNAPAQYNLGLYYDEGKGVKQDYAEAVKWFSKAAEQGDAEAQSNLGNHYIDGRGVTQDYTEAAKWYGKAAELGNANAQYNLGVCYNNGEGVEKNFVTAANWIRRAAEQGNALAQNTMGKSYYTGRGVLVDYAEAVKWNALASAEGNEEAVDRWNNVFRKEIPKEQITEGQRLAREFIPRKETPGSKSPVTSSSVGSNSLQITGTGFFITDDGYLISNYHVVKDATKVRLVTSAGLIDAKVVKVDAANDLALLKADGRFAPLPISSSRSVKLGGTVATVGFPNTGLQGFAPKFARGEIASLSGAADDARYFQISVPVQPGNSGGALVDEHGNVVGVVSAKLNAAAALAASGALPENVNYAVKSSFLLSFLESVPEVSDKLKTPVSADRKFEDVVQSAQDAAVLVLVY